MAAHLGDSALIESHVRSLFDAYLAGDRDQLVSGRTEDWKGFQIRSTRLIRGKDRYRAELERAMQSITVERYEFLDFEVDLRDDLALVYYVARDWLVEPLNGSNTVLIRALDVYERGDDGWIQIGSNICAIPDDREP